MENINPKSKAGWISLLFLTYALDIFKKGSKNGWTTNNLYSPLETHRSSRLGKRIEREWKNHISLCNEENKPIRLKRLLLKIFWPNICFDGCLVFLFQLTRIPEPLLIGIFLSYFRDNSKISESEARFCVVLLIFVGALKTILFSQMRGSNQDTAVKVRSTCNGLILRKVLRMSKSALQDKSSGNILNLISNDLNRLDVTVFLIHMTWATPLSSFGAMYLLYYNLGLRGLIGVGWLMFPLFLQGYFAKKIAVFRTKIAKLTGERLKLMNEMLSGIQIIKMYRWETNFSKFINISRLAELEIINKCNYFKFIIPSVAAFISVAGIFAAILSVVMTGSRVSVAEIYSLVAYYSLLSSNISQMLPASVLRTVELRQDDSEKCSSSVGFDDNQNVKLDGKNDCEKPSETEKAQLISKRVEVIKDVSLELRNKEFVGIVGAVGSGKSSLLSTILGETYISSGHKFVNGSISYASQEPWIFDGTIRENILFHQLFEETRYRETLRVCGLQRDLSLFPSGDETQVGERGVCLSGGQKARINLARAVYKKADIYLFDDPLSSLDIHVCNYLVSECFKKFLADKCIILVTHHLQYLEGCTKILVLELGDVKGVGTFCDLQNMNIIQSVDYKLEIEDKKDEDVPGKPEKENSMLGVKENPKKILKATIQNQNNKQKYFLEYLKLGKQSKFVILVFLMFLFCQLFDTLFYLILGYWTNIKQLEPSDSSNLVEMNHFFRERKNWMYIFGAIVIALGILSALRSIFFCEMVIRNSKMLHADMLEKTIGGKMQFFLQNTSGHILSWFSKDLGIVDEILSRNVLDTAIQAFSLTSRLLVVAFINPYLLIVIAVMILAIPRLLNSYRNTARNISRIEGSLMAPVLTHVNAVIKGLSTIRASRAEDIIISEFDRHQDRYLTSWFMFATVFNAFGFSVDLISYLFISAVTISCYLMQNVIGLNGSQIGLALTQAMGLATYLQYGLLQVVQADNSLVALERILEYKKISQETKPTKSVKLPYDWPSEGKITFQGVNVKYNIDQPAVLQDLTFTINSKEKIGIVGRTGAGKTSLINALFRMVTYIEGNIEIDGYNTDCIPLEILRSKISVIPQDAVLFSASLRYNLDPFGECNDSDLYRALKEVNLEKTGCAIKDLNDGIEENGANLSVGQKQLINLARAILKNNRIVVLDEATSNIDSVTDDLIQSTIRRNFSDCTIFTIAHRISTVMDSDRIMVIDSGKLIQFDTPNELLRNEDGAFYKMVYQN
ncbi:hypothetical protein WA026_000915 [Henosepilachna vigintioctopunctata]|uniref:Uncharacterized protein n=1 Tax=Henosepilachna vigintioctopunctata TaxID=420089 RepID=A0AAW1V202_9CUCU